MGGAYILLIRSMVSGTFQTKKGRKTVFVHQFWACRTINSYSLPIGNTSRYFSSGLRTVVMTNKRESYSTFTKCFFSYFTLCKNHVSRIRYFSCLDASLTVRQYVDNQTHRPWFFSSNLTKWNVNNTTSPSSLIHQIAFSTKESNIDEKNYWYSFFTFD